MVTKPSPSLTFGHSAWRRRQTVGFTLMELMIVVALVSILAAIAIPSYADYVRRSNRAAAKAALTQFMARQESWRADRKSFATTITSLGYPVTGAVSYLRRDGSASDAVGSAVYRMEITTTAGPPTAFETVKAVPLGSQAKDKCGTLVIAATGTKSVSGAASGWNADRCWKS